MPASQTELCLHGRCSSPARAARQPEEGVGEQCGDRHGLPAAPLPRGWFNRDGAELGHVNCSDGRWLLPSPCARPRGQRPQRGLNPSGTGRESALRTGQGSPFPSTSARCGACGSGEQHPTKGEVQLGAARGVHLSLGEEAKGWKAGKSSAFTATEKHLLTRKVFVCCLLSQAWGSGGASSPVPERCWLEPWLC